MNIIFFGTPDFVLPVLTALYKYYPEELEAVVTQSPKESGRNKQVFRSSVDNWAYKHKIEVIYDLDEIPEADLGIVAAYGKIIPQNTIENFRLGILNIHPSLLPKYRGASPIQNQIADGVQETGVTIIKMDEKMDHGPIVSQYKDEVYPDDTNDSLRQRLFEKSAEILIELMPNYINGKINLKEQDHDAATFTKIISKEDGYIIDPFADPELTERKFRAYQPWPGIWSYVNLNGATKRLKINKLHLENDQLMLDEVQLEGKNPVTWEEFTRGYPKNDFVEKQDSR